MLHKISFIKISIMMTVVASLIFCLNGYTNAQVDTVRVEIPDTTADPGQLIDIPVRITSPLPAQGATNEVIAFELTISWDTNFFLGDTCDSVALGPVVTSPSSWLIIPNKGSAGLLKVQAAGSTPILTQGDLLIMTFKVRDTIPPPSSTPLHFEEMLFNEGDPAADPHDGSVTIPQDTIKDLRASVQGDNILLEWSALDGVTEYNVYRGTSYDFVPDLIGGSNRIAERITDEDPGTDGVQWTDTGNGANIVGDINTNYFWRVTGVSLLEAESNPSNLAGEFDYELITTPSTDINELVAIMQTEDTRNPLLTAEQLGQNIPGCDNVYHWKVEGQGTEGHVVGLPFNNFDIYAGYPYIVNVTSDIVWTVAGSYEDISFNLITTEGTDINHIGVPLGKGSLTTAEQLGQDIPGCDNVYHWKVDGQGTEGHVVGLPFNNFTVKAGYSYWVNVTYDVKWPSYNGLNSLATNVEYGLNQIIKNGSISGGVPHTAYGKLIYSEDVSSESSNLKLRAWIVGRPEEVLTDKDVGTGYDEEYWWISVSNFVTAWSVGETLYVEAIDEERELRGETSVILTDKGSDDGGEIYLSKATIVAGYDRRDMPKEFVLLPNYPNPFNPETKISYGLPMSAHVKIQIYDISGRLVQTLVDGIMDSGYHQLTWNGQDIFGRLVSSGVYICRMDASGYRKTLKLLFAK